MAWAYALEASAFKHGSNHICKSGDQRRVGRRVTKDLALEGEVFMKGGNRKVEKISEGLLAACRNGIGKVFGEGLNHHRHGVENLFAQIFRSAGQ